MKQKQVFILVIVKLYILFSSFITPGTLEGKVVAIKDGDTIQVLTASHELFTIRLNEIDCPEKKQAFGQKAKEFTSDFCFGKLVKVVGDKQDRYKRILGYVYNQNGENLNLELVRKGLAWQYKYSRNQEIKAMEMQARQLKIGLWADKNPIAPWDFRKKKSGVTKGLSL